MAVSDWNLVEIQGICRIDRIGFRCIGSKEPIKKVAEVAYILDRKDPGFMVHHHMMMHRDRPVSGSE